MFIYLLIFLYASFFNSADITNAAAAVAQQAIKKAHVMRQVAAAQMPGHSSLGSSQHAAFSLTPVLTAGGAMLLAPTVDANALLQQQVMASQALHEMAAARLLQEQVAAGNVAQSQPYSLGTVHTPHGELPKYRKLSIIMGFHFL